MSAGPPSNPPGAPPPSHGRWRNRDEYNSWNSTAEASASDELRILDILTREEGEIPFKTLYYRSGLASDRFRFWIDELERRGAIETAPGKGDIVVALKGKLTH
jgi:hypothetical protein